MKNIICGIICLICAVFALTVPSWAAKRETAGEHTISVAKESGATVVRWDGQAIHRYDFTGKVVIIPEGKLTEKKLIRRKNRVLYIERVVGKVINNKLDGKTSCGGYISYKSLKGYAKKGDQIVTYLIYSPYTKWIDNIDGRCDAIL